MGGPLRLKNPHENEVIGILTTMPRKVYPGPVAQERLSREMGRDEKEVQMPEQSDKKQIRNQLAAPNISFVYLNHL